MADNQKYEIDQILHEMRSDYWRNLEKIEEGDGISGREYLVVHCGGTRYGLTAARCSEVLKLPRIVHVPRLPEHLRGIFNLRGEIVAVTDLCPLLSRGLQELNETYRLVIVAVADVKTALLVEKVEGLVKVEDDQVEPLAEGAAKGVRDLVSGKFVGGEDVIILLDVNKLFERPELFVEQKEQA
jgi:purine-binding chemotaxis protein CheW